MSEERKIIQLDDGHTVEIEEGSVVDGVFTGKGLITCRDGERINKILEGRFINGKLQGKGKATFINEEGVSRVYEGLFREGKLVTEKIHPSPQADKNEKIIGNVFSGIGAIESNLPENAYVRYEGQFNDKKLNGHGKMVMRNTKGQVKERSGKFVDNKLHGAGKLVIENNVGKRFGFEGNFDYNIPSGQGKIFVEKLSGQYLEQEGHFIGDKFIIKQ